MGLRSYTIAAPAASAPAPAPAPAAAAPAAPAPKPKTQGAAAAAPRRQEKPKVDDMATRLGESEAVASEGELAAAERRIAQVRQLRGERAARLPMAGVSDPAERRMGRSVTLPTPDGPSELEMSAPAQFGMAAAGAERDYATARRVYAGMAQKRKAELAAAGAEDRSSYSYNPRKTAELEARFDRLNRVDELRRAIDKSKARLREFGYSDAEIEAVHQKPEAEAPGPGE